MRKLYCETIIDEFEHSNCSNFEADTLLNIFKSIPKKMSLSLARRSYYEIKDFYDGKKEGINKFTLTVIRKNLEDYEHFTGNFQHGEKTLKITAFLVEG